VKLSYIDQAIASLEADIAVLQLAIAKLRAQQTKPSSPKRRSKPARAFDAVAAPPRESSV
jgi:hypothetical protein